MNRELSLGKLENGIWFDGFVMYFFVETFEDCGSVGDLMIFAGLDLKGKYCHNTVTSCIFFVGYNYEFWYQNRYRKYVC